MEILYPPWNIKWQQMSSSQASLMNAFSMLDANKIQANFKNCKM